ncbi:hypothetical protein TH728_02925 [Corynebacterium amycolatum]|uniref:hypothetical protein n=1 Tax=Corynebacterium amycolatum TaxID=43765 RepID=UPI002AAC9184|nr:hypothetical protein [Corynebacterium amycolatum]MDY7341380.1 hypothetical protein [Corynebacterium amycolatum]
MTNIDDLQERISSAEAVLDALKTELQELKKQEPEQENLFGRWATHPEHGRGIILSRNPDDDGEVRFAYLNSSYTDGVETRFDRPESLDLDPATLTTQQDFEGAPAFTLTEGIDDSRFVAVKVGGLWYKAGDGDAVISEEMPACRVVRWGNGQ